VDLVDQDFNRVVGEALDVLIAAIPHLAVACDRATLQVAARVLQRARLVTTDRAVPHVDGKWLSVQVADGILGDLDQLLDELGHGAPDGEWHRIAALRAEVARVQAQLVSDAD
jgi:hypothetical protein